MGAGDLRCMNLSTGQRFLIAENPYEGIRDSAH